MSLQSVNLHVDGMTCGNCARTVERKLSAAPGVSSVSVDLAANTARVEFDQERTKISDLVAVIERLGYRVPEAER
jgi:Cu+-exporting ATPase